jgi:predicted nucleotidyltransferase
MSVASEQVLAFLSDFSRWAASEPDILAVALVGSHARDEAMDGSDVDLVIVAREPKSYLEDTQWAQRFGTIDRQQIEQYGKVTSLRVWYVGSHEVEYGFTDETWSAWPADDGTTKVVSGGMPILWERGSVLSRLQKTS